MDCVYICRPGENEELRYSIRSIVKNLPYDHLWLAGYKPSWYTGNFFSVANTTTKYENIRLTLKTITENNKISDDFILMNDDFFVIKPVDNIETFHGGLLIDKINRYKELVGPNRYVSLLNKTYKFLINQGIENPLDYDIHTPMPMNKEKLSKIIDKRHFPRSLYGNIFNVGGSLITDVKVYPENSLLKNNNYIDCPYISTEDGSFEGLYNSLLSQMFVNKTEYEYL
jgi:hypothetical protein